jgi:hypothetical protein
MKEFPGFEKPKSNYSKLPHTLIDALPIFDSLSEMKIVLYVLRHTWGYQEFQEAKRITMDEFINGRKYKSGRLDHGTGMSRNALKEGIERAVDHGFLVQESDGKDLGRSSFVYYLNIKEDTPSEVDPLSTIDTPSEVDPQGVNSCPPGPQLLTPRPSEVDPRTEKDTLERNFERNTGEERDSGASAQPPAAPSEIPPSGEERPACADGPAGKKTRSKDESLRIQACPSGELLWVELDYSAQAEGRRPPEYYESAQQRDGFLAIFAALGDELPGLVKKALKQGIKSRGRLLSWLEGCAAKRKAQLAPAPSPDDFMARLAADQAAARERVRLAKERTAARLQKEREQHAETV